jgi:rubredoxin
MIEEKRERLKKILAHKSKPNETQEEVSERIRGIVEDSNHTCALCGYQHFSGGIHPFAGKNAKTKDQTTWCNGISQIPAKAGDKQFQWICPVCKKPYLYTNAEIIAAEEFKSCHMCNDERDYSESFSNLK